jgi:hypothetical protein
VYLLDLTQNSVSELMGASLPTYFFSPWSDDSQHFFIVDENTGVHVYDAVDLQEIKIPVKSNRIAVSNAYWIDNQKLLIDNDRNGPGNYSIFTLEKNSTEIAGSDVIREFANDIPKRDEPFNDRYKIGDLISLLHKDGISPIECMYSLSRDKALYSINGYETYLYDFETGKKKYLFKGINFEWSPKESKIKYSIPKENVRFNFEKFTSGDKFETYVYDLDTSRTEKIADFYANTHFSYDDKRVIFYKDDYLGVPYQ